MALAFPRAAAGAERLAVESRDRRCRARASAPTARATRGTRMRTSRHASQSSARSGRSTTRAPTSSCIISGPRRSRRAPPGSSSPDRSPGARPGRDRADRAAQHLGAARLRQRVGEAHRRRAGTTGRGARRPARAARPRSASSAVDARAQHDVHPQRLALQRRRACRSRPPRARRDDRRARSRPRPGPRRLPATLIVSSERPCRNHWPSSVDAREVAVPPHVRPARPVRLEVALAVVPQAARHPRPRLRAHELADLAAHRAAVVVEHVDRHAERGTAERARRQRLHDVRREEARADLGAARDVDDRAAAAADDVEVPAPRRFVPRLAGRREHAQRRQVVRARPVRRRAPSARARASATRRGSRRGGARRSTRAGPGPGWSGAPS